MPRPYSADLRERVIMDCEAGVSCTEAARRYRIGERTVYRWVRVAHVEGRREAKPHAGGRQRVIAGTEDVLRRVVTERNDATLAEQADAYRQRTGRALSPASLCRALKRLDWTRKKKTLRAAEQERPEVQAARAAFQKRVGALDPHRLVFLDESGVLTTMVRLYARAPKGQRACGSAPAGRWQRLTVLVALVSNGLVAAMSIAAATDTAVLLAFLDHVLIPALRASKPDAVVIMDNLSAHKAPAVRERLEAAGLELLYLPRYSPDLSPIEPMWAKIKALLRALAARTLDALEVALANALNTITPQDARGWFKHCGYALSAN